MFLNRLMAHAHLEWLHLEAESVPGKDVEAMARDNPARLLGLDSQG